MAQITARKVAIWTITIILVILGFEFLWLIRNVLFLMFLSILLATGIEPVVNWLRRGPFSKGTGILLVYTLIFAVLALIFFISVPPVVGEAQNLVSGLSNPATVNEAIANIGNDFLKGILTSAYDSVSAVFKNFAPVPTQAIDLGLTVFEVVFSVFTVFVIAFYWLTERPLIKRFIFSLLGRDDRPRAQLLWESVEQKLGAWVRGQLILMIFIGVLDIVGYTLMGLKFALALAVFAGLAELVPMVGPYIGGAPAVLIALTQNFTLAIIVIIFIIVVQLIEGNILVPRIMESAVGVTPLTVIVGILIGSTLAGIGGALLAVPLAAAIQVIFNNILSFGSNATPTSEAVASSNNTGKALATAAEAQEVSQKVKSSDNPLGGTSVGS